MSAQGYEQQYTGGSGSPGFNFGPYIIALTCDAAALGVIINLFLRWTDFSWKSDTWLTRALVLWIFFCSLAVSGYILAWELHLFVFGFGNVLGFLEYEWTSWYYIIETVIRTPVSLFFAERGFRMAGRRKLLLVCTLPLILISFVGAILCKVYTNSTLDESQALRLKVFVYLWIGSEMASDVIVTATLAIALFQSRTGWERTDKVVRKLIIATAFVIIFAIKADSPLIAFFLWSPKLYSISLLIVLNSRHGLRRDLEYDPSSSSVYPSQQGKSHQSTQIKVTTETYVESHRMDPLPHRSINRSAVPTDEDLENIAYSQARGAMPEAMAIILS